MSSLQPLYDVKERLEYAAIAGTGLLGEDFRLRRAAEAMKPLAASSPVLGKISAGLDQLLAAPADRRPGLLLDVLSLVDAVAYTQGTAGLSGDIQDLPAAGGAYRQIAYSQIQPLLTALTTTGGGRLEVIQTNWETHPEYFTDFRILPVLVKDLGDSYGEIGELISKILRSLGPAALPALKAGFDPRGKKDMVRRVQIIEDISGGEANDFYLSQIPEAEKDVRAALVYALRHDESSVEKLIELSETERGNAKKMALWALARMDCPAARDFWLRSEKTKELALQYAPHSTTPVSSALTAEALSRWLAPYEADAGAALDLRGKEALEELLSFLPGKSGPEICGIYRRMAALGAALDKKPCSGANGQSAALRVRPYGYNLTVPFSEAVPKILRYSILLHPAPDLMELAIELYEKDDAYAPAGLTAALLSRSAAEAFGMSGLDESPNPLARLFLRNRPKANILLDVLDNLIWDREYGRAAYHFFLNDPVDKRLAEYVRPLAQPLDRRWYKAIATLGGTEAALDWRLTRLVPLDDRELCAQVGEYLYQRALKGIGLDVNRLNDLNALGWEKCEGLAVQLCKTRRVNIWELRTFFTAMPGGAEQRKAEALRVCDLARKGKMQISSAWKPESFLLQLEQTVNELFPGAIHEGKEYPNHV